MGSGHPFITSMNLLMVAAASLAVVSCASLSLEDLEFHAWKLKFGKVYRSPEEEARRKDIWRSTRRRVLAHNILADQGIKTYRMGMNHLSDMDQQEYMSLHRSLPSLGNNVCKPFNPQTDTVLPPYVNWADKGCVTPVKDQRSTCGSCWAFSAVGALESHTCIKHKRLPALSEQQLVDCAKTDGCEGGTALDAFGYCMKSQGIVREKDYPYKATVSRCRFSNHKPIPDGKIGASCSGCRYVEAVAGEQELKLQRVVTEIGPVSITIPINAAFKDYKGGVYECGPSPPTGYHAMLVVGYGTTNSGEDYWLVKNSYGTSWGEKGYIKMARNKNNNCDIATYPYYPEVQ